MINPSRIYYEINDVCEKDFFDIVTESFSGIRIILKWIDFYYTFWYTK